MKKSKDTTMQDSGTKRWSETPSRKGGSQQKNTKKSQARFLSDKDISKLTVPQIVELIKRLADELEIRAMQNA